MRKLILFGIILFAFPACVRNTEKFVISGKVTNFNGLSISNSKWPKFGEAYK